MSSCLYYEVEQVMLPLHFRLVYLHKYNFHVLSLQPLFYVAICKTAILCAPQSIIMDWMHYKIIVFYITLHNVTCYSSHTDQGDFYTYCFNYCKIY